MIQINDKVSWILVDLTKISEVISLIGVIQYYMDMWTRRSHILSPMTKADPGPKGRNFPWNYAL